MAKKEIQILVMEQKILNHIYVVRGEKIMLDRDLAELYGVETRVLKQAVKRNADRFPKDFMFEMASKDIENIFGVLKELIEKDARPATRNKIGFKHYD
ncbi:ORF6N domain-containing protein [Agriterribacter humi]|uniref:ORF6N domain-containing protein n=1 Tax=Agriterribacter humi TaxID=1104781 RepID=UPI001264B71C|nr:ORF6N domain-containing protein [Agriterribacter humi]